MASPIKKAKFDQTDAFSGDHPKMKADVQNPPTYYKSPPPPQTAAKDILNDWPENLAEPYDPTAIEEPDGDTDEASDEESDEKRRIKAMITIFMETVDDHQKGMVHCPVCYATGNRKRLNGLRTLSSHAAGTKKKIRFHRDLKGRLDDLL